MNREGAEKLLQGRCSQRRKIDNNTYLERRPPDTIVVRLHDTDIIGFEANGDVWLNSGGWRTVTTKDRLNAFSGHRVYSFKGVWYVDRSHDVPGYVFDDGITFHADGTVTDQGRDDAAQRRKDKRGAKRYATDYVAALKAGKVPSPSAGDCLICCSFQEKQGGPDHIRSHFEEPYYVPSLVVRAMESCGSSQVSKEACALGFARGDGIEYIAPQNINVLERIDSQWTAIGFEQLRKSIYRHVLKELGYQA